MPPEMTLYRRCCRTGEEFDVVFPHPNIVGPWKGRAMEAEMTKEEEGISVPIPSDASTTPRQEHIFVRCSSTCG